MFFTLYLNFLASVVPDLLTAFLAALKSSTTELTDDIGLLRAFATPSIASVSLVNGDNDISALVPVFQFNPFLSISFPASLAKYAEAAKSAPFNSQLGAVVPVAYATPPIQVDGVIACPATLSAGSTTGAA